LKSKEAIYSLASEVFQNYPPAFRRKLLKLRKLILKTAQEIDQVGELVETLKWGEPSYLPQKKSIGTTIRISWNKSKPDQCGIYFHCQTNLVARIKRKFGNKFQYERNRAIIFKAKDNLPVRELKTCITMALTYHLSAVTKTQSYYP
jgi:hypothetical protein